VTIRDPRHWADALRRIATPCARVDTKLGAGEISVPLLCAITGLRTALPEAPVERGEIGLWWARVDQRVNVDRIISAPTGGSLLPQGLYRTIEVWTDADLSGLHALWWLARKRCRGDWMQRVAEVRDWHLEHTQPDNATNRPWAVHVFVLGKSPECWHYAETLLHNCMAMTGRPDPLSAWILLDAAGALEASL